MPKPSNSPTSSITIDCVRAALARPLPGASAHLRMAPDIHRVLRTPQTQADCRRGAVLFLLYPWRAALHTLLILRPDTLPDHPGQIAFPGGAQDGDETALETARREAEEEVGLPRATVEVIGELTPIYIPPSNFCIQIIVAHTPARPRWQPNPAEVAQLLEVPLAHFLNPANIDSEERLIAGRMQQAPFYGIGAHKVWGATAMAIAEMTAALAATPCATSG